MRSKFREINESRVNKIIAMIETMEKSARRQKAEGELQELINDILVALGQYTHQAPSPSAHSLPAAFDVVADGGVQHTEVRARPPDPRQIAREVDLRTALDIMCIISTRMEQELFEALDKQEVT